MKSSEICQLAINVVAWNYGEVQYRLNNSLYYAENLKWCNMSWGGPPGYYSEAWHADCLGFVRAMLCGWNGDKNAYGGGAKIDPDDPTAYNCKYFNEAMFLDSCTVEKGGGGIFNDFTIVSPCSLLQNSGHVGLYVGEFQLNGLTYNTCECSYGLQEGGYPTYTHTDGNRRLYKGAPATDSYWDYWGLFNLNGTDYGITEYDGGATGATGFGSALTQEEVNHYFDTVYDQPWLTYAYLERLAEFLYEMPNDYFRVLGGYVYGEDPEGFDDYMLYLDSCIPINMYMGYGLTTPQQLSDFWRTPPSKDPTNYYTVAALTGRGNDLEADTTSVKAKRTLAGIYLALMNPNQECVECVGYPVYDPRPPVEQIIYTQYDVPIWGGTTPEQWAMRDANGVHSYDITGSGVRGGGIDPSGRRERRLPIWMYLKPFTQYSQYRLGFYRKY